MAITCWYRLLPALVLLVLASGCDKGDKGDKGDKDEKKEQSGTEGKAEPKVDKADKDDEDKGHAKLKLGERDWSTERARAQLQDSGHLRITASRSASVDGKMQREALTLLIQDYEGPGSYTTDKFNSNFAGVGFDVEAAEKAAAEKDDDKTTELVKDTLGKSTVVLLQDAKIEITKADEDFIDGTLEWSGIGGVKGPRSISGSFHARLKKD